ncbi:hypothetical protein EDB92DRAFT_1860183 [Lactarius akahatsu]|uniref:Uncharacterized protein n=1 Tax=Lactarius akahatsu TaxID=416441 RepID=A0AAD4LI17_9AGAM|nr:hypothetical protein EDB92DRAFT_1860183 [Lactarius akahatsu]
MSPSSAGLGPLNTTTFLVLVFMTLKCRNQCKDKLKTTQPFMQQFSQRTWLITLHLTSWPPPIISTSTGTQD